MATVFRGVLVDLLMAVMDSMSVWAAAAGDRLEGLAWRDAVTERLTALGAYQPYEELVVAEARRLGLPPRAAADLFEGWAEMRPWPDAAALTGLALPFAFLTNCSASLARVAALRSGLQPSFTLSAEEVGYYKPDARAYAAACERLGTMARDTVFIAGSPYDARGAASAGLQAHLVNRRPEQQAAHPGLPTYASVEPVMEGIRKGPAGRSRW